MRIKAGDHHQCGYLMNLKTEKNPAGYTSVYDRKVEKQE
jgi:hypothetical protein